MPAVFGVGDQQHQLQNSLDFDREGLRFRRLNTVFRKRSRLGERISSRGQLGDTLVQFSPRDFNVFQIDIDFADGGMIREQRDHVRRVIRRLMNPEAGGNLPLQRGKLLIAELGIANGIRYEMLGSYTKCHVLDHRMILKSSSRVASIAATYLAADWKAR